MNNNIKYLVESFIDNEDEQYNLDLDLDARSPYVDLGLPSGTLWATCNLGAKKPEEYGLFYQWACFEGYKSGTFNFDENEYLNHCDYYYRSSKLREEDDAAYVKSNGLARIPTKEQCQELIDNCEFEWTKLNKVKGAMFTGPNKKSIFIPAAGYCSGSFGNEVYNINIWSLNIYSLDPHYAYYMFCYSGGAYLDTHQRYYGFSIRPILNKNN